MSAKRSEADVAGHDPSLRAAMDELNEGRHQGDPLFPEGRSDAAGEPDEFNPHRFQQRTAPPGVLRAMANVDLRAVDSAEDTGEGETEPVRAPLVSPARMVILVLLVAATIALWLGMRLGAAGEGQHRATASAAPTAPAAPKAAEPSAEPAVSAPAASVLAPAASSSPPVAPVPMPKPKATTVRPAPAVTKPAAPPKPNPAPASSKPPGYDPQRPVL